MTDNASRNERRQQIRLPCSSPLRVTVKLSDEIVSASTIDISVGGAQLRTPIAGRTRFFLINGEFEYTFHTEMGPAQCRGLTKWVQRVDDEFMWGVQYTAIADNDDDPLRITIEALRKMEKN